MKALRLKRRTFLRGLGLGGAAVGLPVLDAMLDDNGLLHGQAHAQAAAAPTRLVMFFFPFGAPMAEWTPTAVGSEFTLPRCLEPLAKYKDKLLIPSGLANMGAFTGEGDSHEKGRLCFATGVPPSGAGKSGGGPSLDQVAAQHIGQDTKFPSLAVAGGPMQGGTTSYLSWIGKDQYMPYDYANADLFDKLFMDLSADPDAAARAEVIRAKNQSVLDFVRADAQRLEAKLGANDRLRLSAHLEAVRQLERRLSRVPSEATCVKPTTRPEETEPEKWIYGGTAIEELRIQFDLMTLALQCDLTRVIMYPLHTNTGYWLGETYGDTRGHHEVSHDNGAIETQIGYVQHQMGILAELLDRMNTVEGDKTLLDNSLVYVASEISHGGAHNYNNLPVLLVGGAGGRIRTGRHINYAPELSPGTYYPKETWVDVNRLFLSMLTAVGVAGVSSWGEATQPLDLS